jgi:hypothetical protein
MGMKRNCNNCRALTSFGCSLGFSTEVTKQSFNGHIHSRKPLEECPKPLTLSSYLVNRNYK